MLDVLRTPPTTPAPERQSEFIVPRALVKDLFEHRARIYWTDFLLTMLAAYGGVSLFLTHPALSGWGAVGFTVAAFALFRCGVFIHEIAHMPRDRMPLFKAAWNILFGIPFLMPSFMYKSHADHHNPRHFGTIRDGEYVTLGAGSAWRIAWYVLQLPLLPVLAIARFLLLTPLSLLHPGLRRWTWAHASSLVINPKYWRTVPADESHGSWIALEVAIFVELAVFAALLFTGHVGWIILVKLYALAVAASGLNWLRTIAAHGYGNPGDTMSFVEQLQDSNTVLGHPWLTELLFPVGLRYHCLHHMFPALPYHAMRTAHDRLMAQLPKNSPYHGSIRRGLWQAVSALWRNARAPHRQLPRASG